MRYADGAWIFSASDLTGFLACRHLTHLEQMAAVGNLKKPMYRDVLVEFLAKRGQEHERTYLDRLKADGLDVVEMEFPGSAPEALQVAEAQTSEAMRAGADVIYQASFFDGRWRGHADFLRKVDKPSDLGSYSYEVRDAKLAKRPKASALLQMCSYSEHVARLQGVWPEHMHLILGDASVQRFKISDYVAYYRRIKETFESEIAAATAEPYPDPVEHCQFCRWSKRCAERRRADDHLSLVAGARRDQIKKLHGHEVQTVEALAGLDPTTRLRGLAPAMLARLQDQAAMQVLGRESGKPEHKVLEPPGPDLGLEALPEATPDDLFFDIEGDPYAYEDGLDFLFGLVELGGPPRYREWWAHEPAAEKEMVEDFLDFVLKRFAFNPAMHVYHYSPAEPSSLKRLAARYATREEELDRLLRAGVFVDLYRVVRQGVRLSVESYSIKKLEAFYGFERSDPITGKSAALIEYERYLESGDEQILRDLAEYNRADCESMIYLREWLEKRRAEAEERFGRELARPEPREPEPEAELSDTLRRVAALGEALAADVPVDESERSPEQRARWLLAQLLLWHRREDKSTWWAFFTRRAMTPEELIDDHECLGDLTYEGVERPATRFSDVLRFAFPKQEHKITPGNYVDPQTAAGVEIVDIDDDRGLVFVQRRRGRTDHPRAVIPGGPYDTTPHKNALQRIAEWVITNGIDSDDLRYRAARDLLLRNPPRVRGVAGGARLQAAAETGRDAACRVAPLLDSSCLPIQGPPGTGKTFTGAHMIVTLVKEGHKVGVTANSHKVISNLLEEAANVADKAGIKMSVLQRATKEDAFVHAGVEAVHDNAEFDQKWADGDFDVAAGTSWLFSRPELDGALHTLFVDEAGQFALANAIAVSGAANNVVLLGDPQQLAQPSQGVHPPGSEASVLGHVLGEQDTIAPEQGLFLAQTWRMHPAVTAFISRAFYEGRLISEAGCECQGLSSAGRFNEPGVHFIEVDHYDNRVTSPEETERISAVIEDLSGAQWTNRDGRTEELRRGDILVVAPYNRQVALLRRRLPQDIPVGTVDKFQGQEGVVTFYSMTTSDPEDAPRNFDFLYSLNRLNVAISRAKVAAVVVGSHALLRARCRTPKQMRLVNALCMLHEMSRNGGGEG